MHVVIVGCGRVGSELAIWLTEHDHTVAIIDKDAAAFAKRLPPNWDGLTVLGYGYDRDDLEEAGISRADALIAVTSGDNSNIIAARVARENYEVPYVAARIYDPRRAVIYQRLGIPTVATVSWTVDQLRRRMFPETVDPDWTDPTGAVSLIERTLPEAWAGQKLAALDEEDKFRLVALTREGQPQLPDSVTVGQEGDVLHFMVMRDALDELTARLAAGPSDHA